MTTKQASFGKYHKQNTYNDNWQTNIYRQQINNNNNNQ